MEHIVVTIFLTMVALCLNATSSAFIKRITSWLYEAEQNYSSVNSKQPYTIDALKSLEYISKDDIPKAPVDLDFTVYPFFEDSVRAAASERFDDFQKVVYAHRNDRNKGIDSRDEAKQDRASKFREERRPLKHNNGERRRQRRALREIMIAGIALASYLSTIREQRIKVWE